MGNEKVQRLESIQDIDLLIPGDIVRATMPDNFTGNVVFDGHTLSYGPSFVRQLNKDHIRSYDGLFIERVVAGGIVAHMSEVSPRDYHKSSDQYNQIKSVLDKSGATA